MYSRFVKKNMSVGVKISHDDEIFTFDEYTFISKKK